MTEHILERSLEWEPAAAPLVLEDVVFPGPPFIAGTRKVTIQRDENFRLTLLAEGELANRGELTERRDANGQILAGTFVESDEVTFEAHGVRYLLKGFFREPPDATISAKQIRFRHKASVDSLVRTCTQKFGVREDWPEPTFEPIGTTGWCSDWFTNGPHDHISRRSTSRRRHVRFAREREFGHVRISELPGGGDSWDHFVVDAGTLRFAVCQVPEDVAPDWCHAMSIEFQSPVPDEETRTAVWEIVSFVIGRRLLPLGSTLFDETGWAIEEKTINPVSVGIRALCAKNDDPPVPLRLPSPHVEQVLTKLVPRYLELRDSMGLRNALWGYWSACEAATPIDLAIFRASVEALKKGWYAALGNKSDGTYMSKKSFDEVTRDPLALVEERLGKESGAKEIMNNLHGAYRMSGNEEVRAFFAKIGLRVGAVEEAARRAANDPAHGNTTPGSKMKEYVVHGRAYRTLFARTFLQLLGYDGEYLDRTSPGFPTRRLEVPAGG